MCCFQLLLCRPQAGAQSSAALCPVSPGGGRSSAQLIAARLQFTLLLLLKSHHSGSIAQAAHQARQRLCGCGQRLSAARR